MLFDELVEYTIERYAHLALVEGWKQYVWGEIKRLDEEPPWAGRNIKERFLERVKSIRDKGEQECGVEPNRSSNSQGTS
jgi:hypothetical protein